MLDSSHLEEVKKIFQNIKTRLPNEPQLQKQLDEAFVKQLSKDGEKSGMRDAIDTLSARIVQIDNNFDLIRSNLGAIDLEYDTKFQPTWVEIRGQWRTFLEKTRKNALVTESYVETFIRVHIQHIQKVKTEQERKDALLELKGFIERPDPRGRTFNPNKGSKASFNESEPSDVLVKLKSSLDAFRKDFDAFADKKIIEIDQKVKETKSKIADVEKELEEALKLFEDAEHLIHISHDMITGGALFVVFFHSLAPIHILIDLLELVILAVGTPVISKYLDDVIRLETELLKLQADLSRLEEQSAALKSIKAMVDDFPDVTSISSRIDRLDDIWLAVARDADALRQALETGGKTFEAMRDRIVQMKGFYDSISVGLARYSNGSVSRLFE